MAGVNQAYVSKFLRGEFFDLSENGKTLIYRWYLRFLKHPHIYLQAHNIVLTTTDHHLTASSSSSVKSIKLEAQENSSNSSSSNLGTSAAAAAAAVAAAASAMASFTNVTNTSYDQPKRTRFSFKTEHLMILEKAFLENQYPDQRRREEIAKLCNEARPCSDREKVTEQIITHWFQNKRKISRKANCEGDQTSPHNVNIASGGRNSSGGQHLLSNGGNYGQLGVGGDYDEAATSTSNNNEEDDQETTANNDEEEEDVVYDYQPNAAVTTNSASSMADDYIDEQPGAPAPPQHHNHQHKLLVHDSNEDDLNDDDITFE